MAEKTKNDSSKPQKHGNADKTDKVIGNQDRTREGATPNKAKLPTAAPSDRSRQAQHSPAPDKASDSDDLDLDLDAEDDRAAQRTGRSGKTGQG